MDPVPPAPAHSEAEPPLSRAERRRRRRERLRMRSPRYRFAVEAVARLVLTLPCGLLFLASYRTGRLGAWKVVVLPCLLVAMLAPELFAAIRTRLERRRFAEYEARWSRRHGVGDADRARLVGLPRDGRGSDGASPPAA